MKCEICGDSSVPTFVLLPIPQKDGRMDTIACEKCAEQSSVYCKKHRRPYLGFTDGSTACADCIEELITSREAQGVTIFHILEEKLPPTEFRRLLEWATHSAFVTGDSRSVCVLRAMATKALRRKITIEEVLMRVLKTRSVDYILSQDCESSESNSKSIIN